MGEELNTRERRDWSAMVGPLFPFLIVGVVLLVALCLLVSAVLVTTPPAATPTPGLPLAQARETATAQASATRHAQTQQATLPTRLPTLPSPSPLPTATPLPDAAAYPFALRDSAVSYERYVGGCDWLGVAGDVASADDDPLGGVRVRVTGERFEAEVLSGSSDSFGPAGWQVQLADAPVAARFQVQLVDEAGDALSPAVIFETRDTCAENLVVVRFLQRNS